MKTLFFFLLSIATAFSLVATSGFAAPPQKASDSIGAQPNNYKVCKSTYALCTVASCSAIPGNDKQVACACTVNEGYSVGQKSCEGVKATPAGEQIRSRYYPIKSYAMCSNDRAWASCLDAPCIIDKNNPEAATCACDVVKDAGDYVIPATHYTPRTCTTGIYSSATVKSNVQLTDFLKGTKNLVPFPIQVLNKKKKPHK